MSANLETLLKAAIYLEQQDKFNLSQNGTGPAFFNISPQYHNNNIININRHHQQNHHNHQQQHVSLSAPAASGSWNGLLDANATGVGVSGSGIGNGSGGVGLNVGQLLSSSSTISITTGKNQQHKQQHDYEFTNSIATSGNGGNVTANGCTNVTIISTRSASINGRASDCRMSEDDDSSEISVCDSPPRIPSNSNSNSSPATFVLLPTVAAATTKTSSTATITSTIDSTTPSPTTTSTTIATTLKNNNALVETNNHNNNHEQQTLINHHKQQQQQQQTQTLLQKQLFTQNSNDIENENDNENQNQNQNQNQNPNANQKSSLPIVNNVVASKQMLLNNGVRIAAPVICNAFSLPTTTLGTTTITTIPTTSTTLKTIPTFLNGNNLNTNRNTIQIPQNGKILSEGTTIAHSYPSLNPSSLLATTAIFSNNNHNLNNIHNNNNSNTSNINNNSSNKTFITLTPPPMPNKKFIEPSTPTRIRSYSLSNKFTANPLSLLSNGGNGISNSNNSTILTGNSTHMIIDDIHQMGSSFASTSAAALASGKCRSPPGSSTFALILHQQHGAGSQSSSPLGNGSASANGGRRRTISSNSNGAGNREVHNKLEKNRRAHLKECYDQLKQNLPLKDEDRKKISNLSILSEAHKTVRALQEQEKEVEADHEKLAKKKIILQKRLNTLKKELGPKYDQMFPGIFNDPESSTSSGITTNVAIPSEKETTLNETSSLSSGRGSMLYSSSSSLSSGGSTTMSSPIGAGLQTALPIDGSPVICKTISNMSSPTSPKSCKNIININNNNIININNNNNSGNTVLQQIKSINISANTSPAVSPNTIISITSNNNANNSNNISNNNNSSNSISNNTNSNNNNNNINNSMALSLTAKNITATSVTRGSPTPSTPSPTSSSSSCISSASSSLIPSSPPIISPGSVTVGLGGNSSSVITGRNTVTVNIPNGLKFPNVAGATIGNGTATAAATIIATTTPGNGTNAIMVKALRGCHLV